MLLNCGEKTPKNFWKAKVVSMDLGLHNLKPTKGSIKERKRVGRGSASGSGGTSGRGHKGQKARAGGVGKPGFEGGQTPLYKRIPHYPGFRNAFTKYFQPVNVTKLNIFEEGSLVTPFEMFSQGLISDEKGRVKILGNGELKKRLIIKAHAFSKKALEQVESLGGKGEKI